MVGNYKSYFRNVKRKGKVIFDHSTTLSDGKLQSITPNLKMIYMGSYALVFIIAFYEIIFFLP